VGELLLCLSFKLPVCTSFQDFVQFTFFYAKAISEYINS
jgi:hypothetical protein